MVYLHTRVEYRNAAICKGEVKCALQNILIRGQNQRLIGLGLLPVLISRIYLLKIINTLFSPLFFVVRNCAVLMRTGMDYNVLLPLPAVTYSFAAAAIFFFVEVIGKT